MSYLKGWLLTIQLSIKCLLLHPMRSFLTVLGSQIGVAAVICLLALGEGISQEAQKQIAELGARNIICLLYTSPSPRDATLSRMPSSA